MGLLDNILNAPQKTSADYYNSNRKDYNSEKVTLNCESCGRQFGGQYWMVKSKKSITCPSCYGAEKRLEDFT